MKVSATAVWHKDLNHINKVRDNHVRYFAEGVELTLYVPKNAVIGAHASQNIARLIRAPSWLSSRPLLYIYWCVDVLASRRQRPEIVIGLHGSEPVAWILAKLSRSFLVQDVWDQPGASVERGFKSSVLRLYGFMTLASMRGANIVLASGELESLFSQQKIASDKIIKVPNGVTSIVADEQSGRLGSKSATKRCLFYSGAFGDGRGAGSLLEALDLLGREEYEIHFQCVGPLLQADYIHKYEEMALRHKCISVQFTGNVESTKALKLLDEADVCLCLCDDILQYRWTYPVKMGEYFQARKQIVATGLPGMRSQADWAGREGHVVFIGNENSPEGVAAGIKEAFVKQQRNEPCDELPSHCTWPVIMATVVKQVLQRFDLSSEKRASQR